MDPADKVYYFDCTDLGEDFVMILGSTPTSRLLSMAKSVWNTEKSINPPYGPGGTLIAICNEISGRLWRVESYHELMRQEVQNNGDDDLRECEFMISQCVFALRDFNELVEKPLFDNYDDFVAKTKEWARSNVWPFPGAEEMYMPLVKPVASETSTSNEVVN